MFDCADVPTAGPDGSPDPRLDGAYYRCLSGSDGYGTVLLVGVVHDHPASTVRVAQYLRTLAPSTLALELPPLAVPLFRLYAGDAYTPPRLGGEMSAAIQAAGEVHLVGIDAPSRRYLRELLVRLWCETGTRGLGTLAVRERETGEHEPGARGNASIDVARTVLRDLVAGTAHALACRIAAAIGSVTPLRPRLYSHIEYDASLLDSPDAQAAHERSHLSQRQTFLRAIEVPRATQLIDAAREESMAARIRTLRREGDVIAVVGMEHLDPVARLLADTTPDGDG